MVPYLNLLANCMGIAVQLHILLVFDLNSVEIIMYCRSSASRRHPQPQAAECGCVHLPSKQLECLTATRSCCSLRIGLCCLYVGHGHFYLIFSFSLSHSLLLWQFATTFSKYWRIKAPPSPPPNYLEGTIPPCPVVSLRP